MTMVFFWKLTYKINVKFLEITNLTGVLKRNFRILNLYINIAYFPFQMFFQGAILPWGLWERSYSLRHKM